MQSESLDFLAGPSVSVLSETYLQQIKSFQAWFYWFVNVGNYLSVALGVRPLAVFIKNAGVSPPPSAAPFFPFFRFLLVLLARGLSRFSSRSSPSSSSSSSSSSSEDSSLSLLPLTLFSLGLSFSTLGLAPRLMPPLFSSFWWNIWISLASRIFSSGSQVLYLGLQPFHLTRYSGPVLPALCLYKVWVILAKF